MPEVEKVCQNAKKVAVLENVMNPTNVGAIFRSAAALNMDAVLLTGGCSNPLYRRASRVSMGTVFQIPWTFIGEKQEDWIENGIRRLHGLGFQTAALALSDDSATVKTFYKENGYYRLQPENDNMEPIIITGNLQILGKVFGVFRFFS